VAPAPTSPRTVRAWTKLLVIVRYFYTDYHATTMRSLNASRIQETSLASSSQRSASGGAIVNSCGEHTNLTLARSKFCGRVRPNMLSDRALCLITVP
jgi:hypothetical protein